MKTYEAVFILNERQVKDGGEALTQEIVEHLTNLGGRILRQENMGRRQFARPINKQTTGIYLNFVFEMAPDKANQIADRYQLNPSVTRVGVLNYEGPPVKS